VGRTGRDSTGFGSFADFAHNKAQRNGRSSAQQMPMTERLYYSDAYATRFDARVSERTAHDGRPALILDRTCFYPASGGQPPDGGQINGVAVIDVLVREEDGAILHVLAADVPGEIVAGVVDWARRFDHMQNHTGQHILTRAFSEAAGAETVSFHLGAESATIDLDRQDLGPGAVDAAEDLANRVVMQNLPVRAWFPAPEELAGLALRKTPEVVNGRLRVVRVGDFDRTACGGTHVACTGEIGLIKIIRTEKYKSLTRVEFRCGWRALRDYRAKNAILLGAAAALSTGYAEAPAAIERLQAENKSLRADLRAARQALLAAEADVLRAGVEPIGGLRVIAAAWEGRDPAELRALASRLAGQPGTVCLLGVAGEAAQVIMACSADVDRDMLALLRGTLAALAGEDGARRGGGRPDFAQGGGLRADLAALRAALEGAARSLLA